MAFIISDIATDLIDYAIKESSTLRPCIFNTEFEGKPAYASGDLIAPHPENKELWRIAGRKDDQIMHSNGEKTNPGPMGKIR